MTIRYNKVNENLLLNYSYFSCAIIIFSLEYTSFWLLSLFFFAKQKQCYKYQKNKGCAIFTVEKNKKQYLDNLQGLDCYIEN